jgi:RES domain-containing protein
MRLWRISNHADLSGEGGLRASGRWHSKGRRVVYLSDHPASALLEVLVHLEVDVEDLPTHFQLLTIEAPVGIVISSADEDSMAENWRGDIAATRAFGDEWLRDGASALLRVPSAIVPASYNYLLNPAHADAARLTVVSAMQAPFDRRLVA